MVLIMCSKGIQNSLLLGFSCDKNNAPFSRMSGVPYLQNHRKYYHSTCRTCYLKKNYYTHLKPLSNWVEFYFCDVMFCKTLINQVVLNLPPDSWKRPVSVTPRILPSFWCITCDHQGLYYWDPSLFHWPLRCRRWRSHPPMLRLGAASCLACNPCPPAQLQREPCSSLSFPNFPNAFWEVLVIKTMLDVHLTSDSLGYKHHGGHTADLNLDPSHHGAWSRLWPAGCN